MPPGHDLLQSSRDVHTIAENIFAFDDDIAECNSMRKVIRRLSGIFGVIQHCSLHLNSAPHCLDDARNSSSSPSPIVLTMRPPYSLILGSIVSRRAKLSAASTLFVATHHAA